MKFIIHDIEGHKVDLINEFGSLRELRDGLSELYSGKGFTRVVELVEGLQITKIMILRVVDKDAIVIVELFPEAFDTTVITSTVFPDRCQHGNNWFFQNFLTDAERDKYYKCSEEFRKPLDAIISKVGEGEQPDDSSHPLYGVMIVIRELLNDDGGITEGVFYGISFACEIFNDNY